MFLGLGPGGLPTPSSRIAQLSSKCLSGSSHGGKGHQGEKLKAGPPYDKENITSLLGGSGGEIVFIILIFSRIFSLIFALHYLKITRSYG